MVFYRGRHMGLNIKDPEAHKLAQELAEATGESMTRVVTMALKEKLARVRRAKRSKTTANELRAIEKRFRSHLKGPVVEDHGTFLYDDKGLPK
jgi:antitoxin VapB